MLLLREARKALAVASKKHDCTANHADHAADEQNGHKVAGTLVTDAASDQKAKDDESHKAPHCWLPAVETFEVA